MNQKLLIISSYPLETAGVCTQVRWLATMLKKNTTIEFSILCSMRKWPINDSLSGGTTILKSPKVRKYHWMNIPILICLKKYKGVNGTGLSLYDVIPSIANNFSSAIIAGGSLALGIGLCQTQLPYIAWIATTFESENKIKTPFSFRKMAKKLRYLYNHKKLILQEQQVLAQCQFTYAISNFTKNAILENNTQYNYKIETLPIPPTTILTKTSTAPVIGRIISAGRFTDPRKDIKTMLKAFLIVNKLNPMTSLVIAGEQPTIPIKHLITKLNLGKSISFIGKVPNIIDEYKKADVMIVSSLQEGLCLSALEAMNCKVPIVSTRCGGIEDFVINNKTGLLVSIGNEKEMAAAILKIITDRSFRNKLGNQGAELVQKNYNPENIFKQINNHIQQL